ncbi:MAG TPA: methyltransferase domain-containing protein [Opitutus sp.]|nr:methyltransferase domain-containing protein [Opitutus sp.]
MIKTYTHTVDESWFDVVDRCWCGGRSTTPSAHSPHYLVCERCGTHFSSRRLKPDCIERFYSFDGYWHQRQSGKEHPTLWARQELFESQADGRIDFWIRAIERHTGPKRGTAVEVGCAEGTLLRHLRDRGWRAVGIEPDAKTAAAVAERTGLEISAGAFPKIAAPTCDLFIACDVLEHIPEPLAFLRAARAALQPGGVLFLQLPLLERTEPDFGPMNERVFDVQEHVFIYSRDSVATLLETAGFAVLENETAWRRAHEIVVARRVETPPRKLRHLANLGETFSPDWIGFIDTLNAFAAPLGLRQFTNWSKIWEYPWLWHRGLSALDWRGRRVIDLGSEQSPFPWWLATQGAVVTLVETRRDWIGQWEAVRAALGDVKVDWQIVDSCRLPFADNSVDAATSFSVIEHQDDKRLAVSEVARVLKPDGRFGISFDICEPSLGMTFPEWNGRALTMAEFEREIWNHPAFRSGKRLEWNREDIGPFLRWHRQTAAHHNYVTGAAILRKQPQGLLAKLRRWFG